MVPLLRPVSTSHFFIASSKNTEADALSRLHAVEHEVPKEEQILPPSCFVGAISWDFDQVLTRTPRHQIPAICPPNKLFVPAHLQTLLNSWAHIAVASSNPVLNEPIIC